MNRFILLLACLLGFAALIRGSPVTNEPVDDAFESSEADVDLDKRSPPIPWDQIKIEDVVYGGSGCPAGSAAWSISSDKQALTGMSPLIRARVLV